MKSLRRRDPVMHHAPPEGSIHRVHDEPLFMPDYVVGDHEGSLVEENMPMEIMEDEEAGKVESRTPKRIRNPGVQVIIGSRRRIIGNHRGTGINIIVVDHLGAGIGHGTILLGLAIFVGWRRGGLRGSISSDHFHPVPVFHGDGFILVGVMNDCVSIDIFINDGIADPAFGNCLRGGRLRNAARSYTQPKPGLQTCNCLQSLVFTHP
jgi:hypothetical protein